MQHTLPAGVAVITALYELGEALGYVVQREHLVGKSAAVDLSWTAADSNDIPLFIFEVESTASQGLANNAAKVYGSPPSELPKPLFFFHLVLKGSKDNERIRNVQRTYGQQNYRVYRLSDEDERSSLPSDILEQHRRVSRYLEPAPLAAALNNSVWGPSAAKETLRFSEKLLFDASYLHDYAMVATEDSSYLSLFTSRLRYLDELANTTDGDRTHLSQEGYQDGPGSYIPGLIEIGLRIYAGDIADDDGPVAFEQWATSSDIGFRVIDAVFGLSRDYDWHVIAVAPFHYSLVAALLVGHPRSRDWVINDLSLLLDGERASSLSPRIRLPAVVWLAHLQGVTSPDGLTGIPTSLDLDARHIDLQAHAQEVGGIPSEILLNPPTPIGSIDDKPSWWDAADGSPLPSSAELIPLVLQDLRDQDVKTPSPLSMCLETLLTGEPYENPKQLLAAIYNPGLLMKEGI